MCGRFFQVCEGFESWEQLGMDGGRLALEPADEIRPSQLVSAVLEFDGKLCLRRMQWGLPHSGLSRPVINARSETLADKPMFRQALAHRRCLIPASGWFEWRREGAHKRPYRFEAPSPLFSFAGLWWPPAQSLPNGAVVLVTRGATPSLSKYHHRMPVALLGAGARNWLQRGEISGALEAFRVAALPSTGPTQGQLF
ncbi:SOS response-associated peptidase [Ferrimonas sediminicola]|uniref:Abasic site processing protein n=1 Tax=Ferrimonas sediminicola TaxID=2569538 RepID=A0A4U1BF74_9GAMM|nr:SOS response-associated peptidase [Ferrimonas sediminicola]TKB49327.1 SOS response-associated peptidase [Ferrimonas sediminicola]